MRIRLTEREIPKARLRRQSPEDTEAISEQVESMLMRGVIEKACGPYSANCHLVPKKNCTKRLVIDYIPLNANSVKDHYPMPQIADILAHLSDAKYYCALDCTEEFWQIPVAEHDRPKMAFITPKGMFQFRRCPFGFTNAPATYQRTMNEIFQQGLYKRCVVYIDDILVYGRTKQETLENLAWVLNKCEALR